MNEWNSKIWMRDDIEEEDYIGTNIEIDSDADREEFYVIQLDHRKDGSNQRSELMAFDDLVQAIDYAREQVPPD